MPKKKPVSVPESLTWPKLPPNNKNWQKKVGKKGQFLITDGEQRLCWYPEGRGYWGNVNKKVFGTL